jgi:hypothetical protein
LLIDAVMMFAPQSSVSRTVSLRTLACGDAGSGTRIGGKGGSEVLPSTEELEDASTELGKNQRKKSTKQFDGQVSISSQLKGGEKVLGWSIDLQQLTIAERYQHFLEQYGVVRLQ